MPVTAALALGIVTGRSAEVPFFWALIGLGICLLFLVPKQTRAASTLPFFFLLGLSLYGGRYAIFSEHDVRVILGNREVLARVRGTLLETPSMHEIQRGEKTRARYTARIKVDSIDLKEGWKPAEGEIASLTRGELGKELFEGQQVEVYGILRPPPEAQISGLFDFRKYLRDRRIFYQLTSESAADWHIVRSPRPPPITERFRRWAKNQLARGVPEDESLRLIWAMVLGWQTSLNGETTASFMETGTMHIFAISGLHVACIATVLLGLMKILGIPRHRTAFVIVPLIWFYTLATGWQSSAIRSALMSSIVIVGWSLKRPSALLNSIAASGLLILLWQPEQLMQTSFQLSFAVVLAMALFMPIFEEHRERLFAPDPFLVPTELSWWQRQRNKFAKKFAVGFLVSLAAWCGSLPIVAYYFNMVTPVSLAANLLAVPLSSGALACTLGSLLVPPLGPLFNLCAWALMWATIQVTDAFASFPLGYFYAPKPGLWFFLFYFALLGLLIFQGWRPGSKFKWMRSAALITGLAWLAGATPEALTSRLTIFPISGTPVHGDFAGKSRDFLLNCSTEYEADYLIKRYLRAEGVGTIQNLILARADVAHTGGFFTIENEFRPVRVYATPWRSRSSSYKRIFRFLEQLPKGWTQVASGVDAVIWKALHPDAHSKFTKAADQALVLSGQIEDWNILYVSGLSLKAQRELLPALAGIRADIVISSLGERDDPIEPELLQHLKPKVLIVGNSGYLNQNRAEERLQDLRKQVPRLLSTSRDGALRLNFFLGKCRIELMNGEALLLEH